MTQAGEVLRKLDLAKMMERIIEQQQQSVMAMIRKMGARNDASGVSPEELPGLPGRVIDAMRPDDLTTEVARIYSENELNGLSDFSSTPADQTLNASSRRCNRR